MILAQSDAGLLYWKALLIRNTKVVCLNLDEWDSHPTSAADLDTLGSDVEIFVFSSSMVNSWTPTEFSLAFPKLNNLLTSNEYRLDRNLQFSLRLHAQTWRFQNAFVFNKGKKNRISKKLFLSTWSLQPLYFYHELRAWMKRKQSARVQRKQDYAVNREKLNWRNTVLNALKEKHEFTQEFLHDDLSQSIQLKNGTVTLLNPRRIRSAKAIPFDYDAAFFNVGGYLEEFAYAVSNLQSSSRDKNVVTEQSINTRLVLSTLVFNDFMFIEPWMEHYRKYGVEHFLIYFNAWQIPKLLIEIGESQNDVTIIPWGFEYYWIDSKIAKRDFHVAQPMQLHHSLFLIKQLNMGSHLLYLDIDEYVIGNSSLCDLIATQGEEISFVNVWASCDSIHQALTEETRIDEHVDFSTPSRKKTIRSIDIPGQWPIHGSNNVSSYSKSHVMLHFGDISNQPDGFTNFVSREPTYYRNLKKVKDIDPDAFIRKVFETRI